MQITFWHSKRSIPLYVFNAFFIPTYQATIPLVTGEKDYAGAIALSSATYQLLGGVIGPSWQRRRFESGSRTTFDV